MSKFISVKDFVMQSADGNVMNAALPAFNIKVERHEEKQLGPDARECISVKIADTESAVSGASLGVLAALINSGGICLYFHLSTDGLRLSTFSSALTVEGGGLGGWDITVQELIDSTQGRSTQLSKHLANHLQEVFPKCWKYNLSQLNDFIMQNIYRHFLENPC